MNKNEKKCWICGRTEMDIMEFLGNKNIKDIMEEYNIELLDQFNGTFTISVSNSNLTRSQPQKTVKKIYVCKSLLINIEKNLNLQLNGGLKNRHD